MLNRFFLVLFGFLSGVIVWGQEGYRIITQDTLRIRQQVDRVKAFSRQYPDSAVAELRLLLQRSQWADYATGMRQILMDLAALSGQSGQYESALRYAQQGLQLCDSTRHRAEIAALYNTIGNIYDHQARFQEAYDAFLIAERFAYGNRVMLGKVWNNMGIVLRTLGYPDKALRYLDRAINVAINEGNGYMWAALLLNLHKTYTTSEEQSKQHDLLIDSAIAVAKSYQAYALLFTAMIHKSTVLLRDQQAKEALNLLNASDSLSEYLVFTGGQRSYRFKIMGMAYQQLGDYREAEKYLLWAGDSVNDRDRLNLDIQLTELYIAMGDYRKAYHAYRRYKDAEDSLGAIEIHRQVNELEAQYRTAEKDKRLAENKLLLTSRAHQVEQRNFWLGITGGVSLFLIGFFLVFYRNVRQKQRLQVAKQENIRLKSLIEGEEQERERISGELHDGIGGILSAAKMSFSGLKLSQEGNTQKYVQGVQLLDDAYKELRRTAHNLSPVLLKREGLVAAVSTFCNKIALAYPPEIRFQHFGDFKGISEALELTTYRIIQELVHNAIKHARADQILVQLRREECTLNIAVEDNGIGMQAATTSAGIGLENVQVRVHALHGMMDIDSREGAGTTVYVLFEW